MKDSEEVVVDSGTKRTREDEGEVEKKRRWADFEDDVEEEEDSDLDLDMNWVEFAVEVNGIEMVKDINVECVIDEDLEGRIMEAFDDLTGLKLDVNKLKNARKEEVRYIETHGIWEV